MPHITAANRHQITFGNLEEQIEQENPVRVIDGFVEQSLIPLVYNLRRTITILGTKQIIEKLKSRKPDYKRACRLLSKVKALEPHRAKIIIRMTIAA
jgi:hypothetical protein